MSVPASPFFPTSTGIICSACALRDGNLSGPDVEEVYETEILTLSGKSLLDVLRVGGGAGVTHLEPLCRLRMIFTQRTHVTSVLRCGSTIIIESNGTMGITFAAWCICTKACTVLDAHSGSLSVRFMLQLFHTRHRLFFFVSLLAVSDCLSS